MSQETIEWLNNNTLIGYTGKRGTAWHWDGDTNNHYEGAVPVDDVIKRLFSWSALDADLMFESSLTGKFVGVPDKKVYYRSDNGQVIGIHGAGHEGHDYKEWLLENASKILDADLAIGQAGLLKGGAVAWVSVEMEDTIEGPADIEYRPQLLLATSFNGTLATTYKMVDTIVVCDNTLATGIVEATQTFKAKHTKNSRLKLTDARSALEIMHTNSDQFSAELDQLVNTPVTDSQWEAFLNASWPLPVDEGKTRTQRLNRQEKYREMYTSDPRCAPWMGTAFGVLQTDNTYRNHENITRGTVRPERNRWSVLQGSAEKDDTETLKVLERVLLGV